MKKNSPQITRKTAAEVEEERKRRAAEWWNKVIVYYLNQMYHAQVDAEIEKYRPKLLVEQLLEYYHEQNTVDLLNKKEPGKLSAMEILERMQAFQEEDSPFRDLYRDIKEDPTARDKIERSMSRCVEEAPKRILARKHRNAVHVRMKPHPEEEGHKEEEAIDPEEARREEERLRYEMTFLRTVMPPKLYRQLCEGLVKQGRMKDPELDFLDIPEEEKGEVTYEDYVERHRALPRAREGELGNVDELFTAAAYMLAAYEQKDELSFDEKAADARAMEISGSKAFRQYMKSHPGSLLAAAQNTGLEATQGEIDTLNWELKKRDDALASVHDAFRTKASGQTAAYHQTMNALGRFLRNAEEPSKKEKDALSMTLAQYILTEGDPKNPNYCREGGLQAARALQILLPEKDFQKFLETANEKRSPEDTITVEKLAALAAEPPEAAPQKASELEPPVLKRPDANHHSM